jgi:capsule polysaccharide export protein KpsE/RkpR
MSGEPASVRQRLSNEEDIVSVPRDNEALADDLRDRQVDGRTVANLWLFWADRRFILRAGVYALLASMLIAILIPARYESVTRLMPPDSPSGLGLGMLSMVAGRAGLDGLGAIAGDALGMKNSGALFVGVLQSQTLQDRLIQQFNLMRVYHDGKVEDARKDLAEHTDISEDRKSGIISVGVTDHDPKRASAMAKSYVDELDRLVAKVSTSAARRERIFLEERLKAVKGELDDSAKKFSDFASKNSAIDIPAQGRAMVDAAARLQGGLIAAQSELEGLKQVYTEDNVRVRSARARMDELQKKLNEIGSAGTEGGAKVDDSLFPSIRRLPILGVTYADLYRRTKIEETVYELLTEQYEMAKVQEAKEIPSVKVLDAAIVPTKKTFPPRAVIIALGTLLGLALAMTWIAVKTQWESVEANDPRKRLAMEVFTTTRASFSKFSRNGSNGSNGHRRWSWWKKTEEPAEKKHEDGKPDCQ